MKQQHLILLHHILISGWISFYSAQEIYPQSPRCTASVDRTSVEAGETVTYTVEISGPDAQMSGTPVLPDVTGIKWLSPNPGESTSVQIINGVKSESKSYHFILRAVGKGTIRINAADVPFKGRRLKSNVVSLLVGESKSGQSALSEDIFFRAEISRDELFVGEQLIVTFKIYTRLSATNYNIVRLPNYIGFWAEELPVQQKNIEKIKVGGRIYRSEIIKRTAVFPAYSGELIINSAELDCEVNIPRNKSDLFSDPFLSFFPDPFGQTVVHRLVTPPVTVKVKDLPEGNQPRDFNGLVGQFDISLQSDKTNLKTGEPVTCKVIFTGTGNIMAAEIPNSPFSADFEIFDPVTRYTIQREPTSIKGEKIIEWMAIPRKKGTYPIAPVTFSYYDPSLKKYLTKKTPGLIFEVSQGRGGQADSLITAAKTLVLAGLKEKTEQQGFANSVIFSAGSFWILFAFPPAVLVLMTLWRFTRPGLKGIAEKNKIRNASKIAGKNIAELIRLKNDRSVDSLYRSLHQELSRFLSTKTGTRMNDLTPDQCAQIMRRKAISADRVEKVLSCLMSCEEARYSPSHDSGRFYHDANNCLDLIHQWEQNITMTKQ